MLSDTLLSVKAIIDPNQGAYVTRPSFTVDLSKTPSQDFASAMYDDRGVDKDGMTLFAIPAASVLVLGITSIGSSTAKGANDMRIGAFVGGLYIVNDTYGQLRDAGVIGTDDAPWPPSGTELYSLTSVAYPDGRRYHGFHGRVVSRSGNTLVMNLKAVTGWQPTNVTVDVTNVKQCDPTPPSAATSGATPLLAQTKVGAEGAVFLALPFAVSSGAPSNKLPSGQGG
ncbi:MAG TPA: hypothetical protein VGM88_11950 [Kofleriaceae bacterium]